MTVSAGTIRAIESEIRGIVEEVLLALENPIIERIKKRERIPQNPLDLEEIHFAEYCEGVVDYDAEDAIQYLEALTKDASDIQEGTNWKNQLLATANDAVVSAVTRITGEVFIKLQDAVDDWYDQYTASGPFKYEFNVASDSLEISVMTDQYDPGEDNNVWGVIYVPINY